MSYHQLNADHRLKLEAWKEACLSNGEMARRLGVHVSTIGREFSRNGESRSGWYVGKKADKFCRDRRSEANRDVHAKLVQGSFLALYVEEKLRSHWSPEQIHGRLKREKKESVSHERIYDWIYHERKDLIPFLRHSKKRRYEAQGCGETKRTWPLGR
jgi:transposase, IS30 family